MQRRGRFASQSPTIRGELTAHHPSRTLLGGAILVVFGLLVALLGAGIGSMNSGAPAHAADSDQGPVTDTTSCGYGTGGVYSHTLCWLDMSKFDPVSASTTVGHRMSVALDGGYKATFVARFSTPAGYAPRSVWASSVPTFPGSEFGTSAYHGIPGKPALYQTVGPGAATDVDNGATTISLDDISITDSTGAAVTGYGFAMVDAEATGNDEKLEWKSTSPINLIETVGGQASGNFGCPNNLVGLGTTTVSCQTPNQQGDAAPAVILSTDSPSSVSMTAYDVYSGNVEAIAFAVQTSKLSLDTSIVGRTSTTDSIDTSITAPEGTVVGSATTGSADTASTKPITVLPRADSASYTLAETATPGSGTKLDRYDQRWMCTNAAVDSPTALPSGSGTTKTVVPQPGDDISCTINNMSDPAAIGLVAHADAPVDVNGDGFIDAGDTVQYRYTVSNDGSQDLSNVSVSDDKAGPVSCPRSDLGIDESEICVADAPYTITDADVDTGTARNTATAAGSSPSGAQVHSAPASTDTPTTRPAPALGLETGTDVSNVDDAGDRVMYRYPVVNIGNTVLNNIAVKEGSFTGSGELGDPVCDASTLAPGASGSCTTEYSATQADIDSGGSLTGSATAVATEQGTERSISSEPSTGSVEIVQNPGLSLVKSASLVDPDSFRAGAENTYTYVVTNTGNVTLGSVSIVEGTFSGTGSLPTPTCLSTSLAPGAQTTCHAVYRVTADDVAAGRLSNSATATGTPPGELPPPVSAPSDVTIPQDAHPGISLVKAAAVDTVTAAGQTIPYTFSITNTGNVTVTGPQVTEGAFTGHGTMGATECPALADGISPGQTIGCHADYTVVAADLTGNPLSNTATATVTSLGGNPTVSDPSTATVKTTVVSQQAQPTGGSLASTGSTTGWILGGLAVALLACGSVLAFVFRHRRPRDN